MAATTLLSDNGVTSGTTGYTLTGGNDGTLQLQTTTAGGTATTAMTINSSQNVGIGVTGPTTTGLSLAGTKNLTWQYSGAGSDYANIFNQENSASLVLGSGYRRSATANGFASSFAGSWAKSAIAVGYGTVSAYTDAATTVAVGTDVTPTLRMQIDVAGRMRIAYQPSFSAYGPASTGTAAIVIYGSTRSNVGSHYNTATGIYTAPIAGVYVFTFNSLMNVNGEYCRLYFRWNGVSSPTFGDTLMGGTNGTWNAGWSYACVGLTWVVSLGQGDTVTVWNDGPTTTYGTGYGTFSGYMLG